MKFRYKVLMINIILLSLAIGTIGFFMIKKNFELSLEHQVRNAIEENNLFQSVVEYNLLDVINNQKSDLSTELASIGKDVSANTAASKSTLFIVFNNTLIYSNSDDATYPEALIESTESGKKGYILTKEENRNYIIVSSASSLQDKKLCILTKRDITDSYILIKEQANYYSFLLVIVLLVCSVSMYVISYLLTKPLEHLTRVSNSFGNGNYSARADVGTHDEVGVLATTYNDMACAVEKHIDMLSDSVRRKEQFVADFTHEMKTPMTSIIGYADTIRSRELDRENQIMAASYIVSEGKRLETMSRKLFDLIGTTNGELSMVKLDTKYLADCVANSVHPAYETKGLILDVSVETATIKGDIELLKSALINLLDNARKASAINNRVSLTGVIKDSMYEFSVRDYGVGIKKEHLDKLCDEFYMVDKARSRKEGGAGLGLSLVNTIVSAHNAAMSIDSTYGEGTTVTLSFSLEANN